MPIKVESLSFETTSGTDIIDITSHVNNVVKKADVENASVVLFTPGSTAALSTIEFESGAVNDLRKALDRIAPEDMYYEHNERWQDGNGYSHVRAALMKPSLQIPVVNGDLLLGTWQQIVLLDFDNKPRKRKVAIQLISM